MELSIAFTWLGTPSSANLRAALTDETGTGAAVFANSASMQSLRITDGTIVIQGSTFPQLDFTPSSGATQSAQFVQSGDHWQIASSGVAA